MEERIVAAQRGEPMSTSAVAERARKNSLPMNKSSDFIRHALPIAAENGRRGRVSFTSGGPSRSCRQVGSKAHSYTAHRPDGDVMLD
jgi:hypothetical protein